MQFSADDVGEDLLERATLQVSRYQVLGKKRDAKPGYGSLAQQGDVVREEGAFHMKLASGGHGPVSVRELATREAEQAVVMLEIVVRARYAASGQVSRRRNGDHSVAKRVRAIKPGSSWLLALSATS